MVRTAIETITVITVTTWLVVPSESKGNEMSRVLEV